MAIYRVKYGIEGDFITVADSPEEALREFYRLSDAERGAIGQLTFVDPPKRDLEAEAKDCKKTEALFKEASLG